MNDNKPIMEGRESHIYGDFIRETSALKKKPQTKAENLFVQDRRRYKAPVMLLGFINRFQHKPVCPEDPLDCFEPLFGAGPADEESARVCVCLVKLTPELLNQCSVVLWFCLTSLSKYTPRRVFLYVHDALSRES